MTPLISVMVVVMGAAEHFEETLVSLLEQTIQDFEIVVVDGGLFEPARQMLARYSSGDARIKVFPQQEPGIAAARTQAMALSSGKYCAVNDADDISLPHRFERQIEFLESHPEISLCGAWIQTFGAGPSQIRQTPPSDAMIRSQMMFLCPFAHSTVIWRRVDILRTGQTYLLESSEDYDLWARLLPRMRFANLPEVLVHYRIHEDQRSNFVEETDLNWGRQMAIRSSLIELLGVIPTRDEAILHQRISTGRENEVWASEAESWLKKLQNANRANDIFPRQAFDRAVADRWWVVSLGAKSTPVRAWRFISSTIISGIYPGVSGRIVALVRFIKQRLVYGIKRML